METFRLNKTINIIKQILPLIGDSINKSRDHFGDHFEDIGNNICSCLFAICDNDEDRYFYAVKGYVKFCTEHLLLQKKLEREGHYLHNDFDLVNNKIYNNASIMDNYYLSGLLLSTIFWPNHLKMFLFFMDQFCDVIVHGGKCCDIGIGHGWLTSSLLKKRSDVKISGIDISPYALIFAEKLLKESGIHATNYDLKLCDIRDGIPSNDNTYDAIIFSEILEHLSCPNDAINEIIRILKPGGIIYITAAIFAANIDHIYLFKKVDDVKNIILNSGLKITEELILPVSSNNNSIIDENKMVPINYACKAKKINPFINNG